MKYTAIDYARVDFDTILFGDVSDNSIISAHDASLVAQYKAGLINLTPDELTRADVSGDGEISYFDAGLIAQYTVGLIDKLR
jgi:hypothetical protein